MYRTLMFALAVVFVVSFAGQTQAADGNLSTDMLAAAGLSSMQVMTDTEGESIRGKGYVEVWGSGTATYNGYNSYATQTTNYYGSGGTFAIGGNVSVVGTFYYGRPSPRVFAFGASAAYAY